MSRDLLWLALLSAAVPGDNCRAVQPVRVIPADKVVAVQPVAAVYPAYGPSYSNTDALLLELLKAVKENTLAVQQLHADTLRLAGKPVPALGAAALTPAGIKTAKCAVCHRADVAGEKGSGFVLIEQDGSEAPLSVVEQRRVAREVEKGRMPPPGAGQLTETEKAILIGAKP